VLPWMRRLSARFLSHEVPPPSGPLLLDAYLLLARRPGGAEPLDTRLELLVGQLSAELSGCRWCIEAGRHRWRKALLPVDSLKLLHTSGDAECFSERERAALGFAAAVAQGAASDGLVPALVLAAARRHFREREIVRLTVLAAGEHFGDCLGARLGTDARPSFPIGVRGLS
jgi:alkylhydroperoxidase family enzyme